MSDLTQANIEISRLLFDPNNYRFQDSADFVTAEPARYGDESVQARAYRRLRADQSLLNLKNSILTNGFLPVERLVVRKFDGEKFVVLEGNRRLAALRWIHEDHASGVAIDDEVLESTKTIPVLVADGMNPAFHAALMGIRHVSGIKEWGGYQRAKLVADMRDKFEIDAGEVSERLGMPVREVNRRYRAFKALDQMSDDEEAGEYAGPDLYPLFHEALAIPAVRQWLKWDQNQNKFTEEDAVEQFYMLITPGETEEGDLVPAKMSTFTQVRELKDILPNNEAKRVLLDPAHTFIDAATVVARDKLSRAWAAEVSQAITALQSIPLNNLKNLSKEDADEIERLRDSANDLLEAFRKLKS